MGSGFDIRKLGRAERISPLGGHYFIEDDAGVLLNPRVCGGRRCDPDEHILEQAGPRDKIYFDPDTARAAIVTCGGLCPGLNDVIRAITMVLWYRYGVREILGLRYGYEGLIAALGHEPIALTPELTEDIHQQGGTILGSSRGPQPVNVSVDFLEQRGINMLFTIGGDGTQRGALDLTREIERRGLPISIIGIPKTIDNDVAFTDRTFGFETAVAMSTIPIVGIHNEAKGVRNGVGLVKLMGREAGFVAAYASLASSDVNLVLVPEIPFELEQLLQYLEDRLRRKSHAVIVAAEGAGQDLVTGSGRDASGNRKLGDIGLFLKQTITEHFAGTDLKASVKYVDPAYTIRSAAASADDSVFCFQLAGNAVHAAMTGRTGMVVSLWNGQFVHVPLEKTTSTRKLIDPKSALWQSVLDNTGQPF